ncbi:DUF2490 domain-containing protein [Methylobacterium aerolatum]|uniref:DUF2490 domain-containing protein n=1 Tax=Methylobacterium aerolatum TaxID=418708 RepID=A0ABU0I277_9HYPH|nr:DUF2490 domain-containing protein [Methylobacterium aerolatum]MDQ0448700.1 hypothetical protein [Methylobacterium aerolatum]
MLPLLASLLVAGTPVPALANDAQLWFNTTLFGSVGDLAYYAEVQPRFGDDISKLDQFFFRPALGWKINDNLKLYQGYAYVEDRGGSTVRIEDRSFQEINWTIGEFNGVKASSRTRFEQRWRSDGRDVGFRVRSQLRAAAPLTDRKGSVAALGWTEVFVALNDADWGPRAGFDQVRTFAGIEIPIGDKSTVELGYLNRLIQSRTATETDHVLSINLFLRP